MFTIETIEANRRLAELLDRVAQGESITITDNGRPVARLVPASPVRATRDELAEVVKHMLAYRNEQKRTLGKLTVREMIEEGRRF